ncbi:hypothetical protein [Wolbachia endosymbiont (group A) of Agelastica alni]|uniref:hypothetical protein n=1 Tax=Wolbachia endosymbiont (group A) of Agelastica alni TaxID=3066130 RepID=UPI003132E011
MPVDVLMQAKELFLAKLKEKSNFAALRDQDEWEFHDLLRDLTDEDFKQICIDKTATESAGKSFKEDIDKCVELAEQGKRAASKYFKKGVKLQAYYIENDNAHRVLNVNLIHYDKSEPTKISDILQQEKDIKELNIYCNKKHEIHAHREGKKRHYKFKEGADYEMTSTWPVKDEFGNVSICTMTMNVSSDGITEILKFNGKDFVLSEEILELIKQNDELYIQGLSLCDAVRKSLEKGKTADVVPTANNNLQSESIMAYQDKEPEGKLDPKVDADNSLPPSSINSNVLIQTEVKLQQIATQTEIDLQHTETQTKIDSQQIETQTEVNLQHTETQTEVASQHIGIQTEINSQQMDELILNNQTLSKENVELKQEMSNLKKETVELKEEKSDLEDKLDQLKHLNKKMNENLEQLLKQVLGLQKESSESKEETQELINKLKNAEAEAKGKEVNKKFAEAKQRIEELEKQTSDLQGKLEKKEREFKAKIDAMCKKLTQLEENLKRNEEEFKSVDEEKRRLEDKLKIVNAGKKESEDKLKEFEEWIDQVVHIMEENEQFISNLKRQMQGLENEHKAQQESYEQEIDELKWKVGKSENRRDELKKYVASTLESMNREHEDHVDGLEEEFNERSEIIGNKVWEVEDLKSELQNSEKEFFRDQVKELSEEIYPPNDKSREDKVSSDHAKKYYTLTGDIFNEPDNVPRKKRKLSGSFSLDSTYYSDEENCDNDLSFNISPISSTEKVAESRCREALL